MSKRRRPAGVAAAGPVRTMSADPEPRPFKPQRKFFVALCVLFAIWVAFLAAMYFKTVYPQRHRAPQPAASDVAQPPSAVFGRGPK